jgi:hypothetical protein
MPTLHPENNSYVYAAPLYFEGQFRREGSEEKALARKLVTGAAQRRFLSLNVEMLRLSGGRQGLQASSSCRRELTAVEHW